MSITVTQCIGQDHYLLGVFHSLRVARIAAKKTTRKHNYSTYTETSLWYGQERAVGGYENIYWDGKTYRAKLTKRFPTGEYPKRVYRLGE